MTDIIPVSYTHLDVYKRQCLYMAIDQQLAAVICIEDPVREEAADVIRDLRDNGIQKIVMMTRCV